MSNARIGVYPGTFDPITNGHLDIIERALHIVDHLVIAVASDSSKNTIFSASERTMMVMNDVEIFNKNNDKRVDVKPFDGLLVNFVRSVGSSLIIRGIRAVSDFEYEFLMSCMNAKLASDIDTVLLPASEKTHFISSRFIKEVARLGGNVSEFVSRNVEHNLKEYYNSI